MITVHSRRDGAVETRVLAAGQPLPDGVVWIDLQNPTPEEDRHIEALLGITVPTAEEMKAIEESSRFYTIGNVVYLTTPVIHGRGGSGNFRLDPVVYILVDTILVSVRETEPTPFRLVAAALARPGGIGARDNGVDVLMLLVEAIVDRIADHLENVAIRLDSESRRLFGNPADNAAKPPPPLTTEAFQKALRLIAYEGEFLSKARESLAGVSRFTVFALNNVPSARRRKGVVAQIASIDKDIQYLSGHAAYLGERVTFLIDAVVGLVSVEQNAIIKLFSVAAVAMMPPTLVASIYGMNFRHMPELSWPFGYPLAIALMVVSAVLPIVYFKRRGWL